MDSPGSQQASTNSVVYGELAGAILNGSVSFNYEHSLIENFWLRLGYGIGGIAGIDNPGSWGHGPMLMAVHLTEGNNKFEFGFGVSSIYGNLKSFGRSYSYNKQPDWSLIPAVSLGYRYQPSDGGLLFRIGLTFDYYGGFPGEISFGYAF